MESRVMKFLFAAFLLVFSHAAIAQNDVLLSDLKAHLGDTVITFDIVSSAYHAIEVKNYPTFLNIGSKYPNQLLTVVIWEDARSKFHFKPEGVLLGKQVCITRKVERFESKPQVIISDPKQVRFKTE